MQPTLKRVAAIHDLSGFGRASLTCIIPTLSAMGIQVCPVPTAILSTHSGGFDDYVFHDLTDILPGYIAHWKKLGLTFDCIYSGFLGSPRQCRIVSDIIRDFRAPGTLVVVDPVIGDSGSIYSCVSPDMIPEMRQLSAQADIITPNYTEAAMLLGRELKPTIDKNELRAWLHELSQLGPGIVIITSAPGASGRSEVDTVAYESASNQYWRVPASRLPSSYPGTGDLFTSVLVGCLLSGESLPLAVDRAVQFISQCIQVSRSYDYPIRDGVLLEKELHLLRDFCIISNYEEF